MTPLNITKLIQLKPIEAQTSLSLAPDQFTAPATYQCSDLRASRLSI